MEFVQVDSGSLDEIVEFLVGEEWPFHVEVRLDAAQVRGRAARGAYDHAFWIVGGGERLGMVRLMSLDDGAPLFDLRVRSANRGRGVGTAAVKWLTAHVFTNYATNRIEGNTRQDNEAMRRAFTKAGYVKEAHYREGWPGPDRMYDAVGYAVLRRDWENGTTTEVNWTA
jgi:RimJ/RimL family protein N-acetyltransferase